ncbi:amino acid ABC transporter substrate-binding protein [Thioclava sp. BHET1]|nr:amino acid ABC transporter substrate-binding protein [Thioclava sp. BHET1]
MRHDWTRRALAASALAALATLGLTGAAAADTATLKTVRPGQLTIAYRTDDKPVSFIQDGKPTGFLVELNNAVAKKLGLKVEYIATDFASMVPGVRNGRYDTAAFDMLESEKRAAIVDFTVPIGFNQARLVTLKTAKIDKVENAGGKTVAITRGSALIPKLEQIAPKVSVREFPNIAASLNALLAHQVDGLFTGLSTANGLVTKHDQLAASQVVTTGKAGFPIAKDNAALKKAYDEILTGLMKDGTFTTLWEKWHPATVQIPDDLYQAYPGMPHQKPAG